MLKITSQYENHGNPIFVASDNETVDITNRFRNILDYCKRNVGSVDSESILKALDEAKLNLLKFMQKEKEKAV